MRIEQWFASGLVKDRNRTQLSEVSTMPTFHVLLTGDDLDKIRMLPVIDPIGDLVSAAHEFAARRTDPMWGGWARRTTAALGSSSAPVLRAMNSGFVQLCTAPSGETAGLPFDDALESVLAAPVREWRSAVAGLTELGIDVGPVTAIADGRPGALAQYGQVLRRFHEAAVASYMPKVAQRISAAHDAHVRLLAEGGVDRLLNSLHPGVTWKDPWLTIQKKPHKTRCAHNTLRQNDPTHDVLHGLGRGLTLQPSAFADQPCLIAADDDCDMPIQLLFPVPVDWQMLTDPADEVPRDALGDLMGHSRSSVLRALHERRHTTSSLARAVYLSPASASEHTSVLRAANLVNTTREGNHVTHALTELGATLVRSAGG